MNTTVNTVLTGKPEKILKAWQAKLASVGVQSKVVRSGSPGDFHALGLELSDEHAARWIAATAACKSLAGDDAVNARLRIVSTGA